MFSQACTSALGSGQALQALELSLAWFSSEANEDGGDVHLLVHLGALTGLTKLRLHSWTYSEQDVPAMLALSQLVHLKVKPSVMVPLSYTSVPNCFLAVCHGT